MTKKHVFIWGILHNIGPSYLFIILKSIIISVLVKIKVYFLLYLA